LFSTFARQAGKNCGSNKLQRLYTLCRLTDNEEGCFYVLLEQAARENGVSKLPAALTILAMLVHALAGCCSHHAHAEPVQVASLSTCGCCHHGEPDDPGGESGHHDRCPTGECQEGRCAFLNSASMTLPTLATSGPVLWVVSQSNDELRALAHRMLETGHFLRPPSTLFELHQVLLI
jgi:hypothetical protein